MNYFDPISPIDCGWRSRVPAFMRAPAYGYDAQGNYYGSAGEHDAHVDAWRSRPSAIVKASTIVADYVARPFDFADLNGKAEPAAWGPVYPKTASAAVEKWRMAARGRDLSPDEKRAHGAAVGDWIKGLNSVKRPPRVSLKYVMPDYAAKCRAEFAATAAADKRAWALGQSKNDRGETIAQAYARAMAEKAERLANPQAYAAKLKAAADRVKGHVKPARAKRFKRAA